MNAREIAAYIFGVRLAQALVIFNPNVDCTPSVAARLLAGLTVAWTRLANELQTEEADRRAVESLFSTARDAPLVPDHRGNVEQEHLLGLCHGLTNLLPTLLRSRPGEQSTRTAYDLGRGILDWRIAVPMPSIPAIQHELKARIQRGHPSGITLTNETEQQLTELGLERNAIFPDQGQSSQSGWSELGWWYESWDVLEGGISALVDSEAGNETATRLSASERLNEEAFVLRQATKDSLKKISLQLSDGESRTAQRIGQMVSAHAKKNGITLVKRRPGRPRKNESPVA
jgi:hypothetical protein